MVNNYITISMIGTRRRIRIYPNRRPDIINKEDINMKYKKPSEQMIKKIEAFPFIKNVEATDEKLIIHFKPKFIIVNKLEIYAHGKNLGKRIIWMGSFSATIGPSIHLDNKKTFKIDCETKHPHVNGTDTCFGNVQTLKDRLINMNKYDELVSLIWMWFHVYTDSGYRKARDIIPAVLKKGFPIWNGKRKRIKIGKLKKLKSYKKNIKRFKDMKCPL